MTLPLYSKRYGWSSLSEGPFETAKGMKKKSTALQYGLTIAAGMLLAIILNRLWLLETRYFVAVVIGIVLVSIAAFFVRRFSDFLLVCFLLSIPLTGFSKNFFMKSLYGPEMSGILVYSGTIALGLPDILLGGLYVMWFVRIFVLRSEAPPRFEKNDALLFLLILAYALSIPGTPDTAAAGFAFYYLLRFSLVYLYISKNFSSRHIPWLFIGFFLAIFCESGLATFQYLTGKWVGLAMDRGTGVRLDQQYIVPGIEHRNRATGTSYESHTFGLYMSMMAQFAFVMTASFFHKKKYSLISLVLFILAMLSVLISFSRSAWLSCAIALVVAWAVRIFLWKEKALLKPTVILGCILLLGSPWALNIIIERFTTAGGELLWSRFEQYPIAWNIWSDHFLFGYGVGNYMEALKIYNRPGILDLPVHNVFLWLGAESGLVGVFAFFGILFTALRRSWKMIVLRHDPNSRIGLAVFCSLIVYLLDGLTDPLYREPVAYMCFWVLVALSVALVRIERTESEAI